MVNIFSEYNPASIDIKKGLSTLGGGDEFVASAIALSIVKNCP